jgi:Carboxypeptidase regulatory-like domain/TonB-dependent Receptor Plug Domain
MKRYACLLGVLAVCLSMATGAWAQETRGSIEGVVKDGSGAVLPGATVEARSPRLVGVQSTTSDGNGVYRFPALAPGTYEVTAALQGFNTKKVADIVLNLGQTLKVDFALPIAGVTESVQVTAESPLIDVKGNASQVSIQADIIDRIPKGRDFTSVINSAPGTSASEARGGGTMVDGASASENRFIVDGLDTTSLRTGTSSSDVPVDFLEQVQVKSGGYNAEYRAATGGVISAITKSGGNSFHGQAGTYYSNSRFLGENRKSLRLNPANTAVAEYITTPRDKSNSVDPVFDIGGPILRDRTWFYVGYNPRRSNNERTATFTAAVPDGGSQTRTFKNSSAITPEDNFLRYTVTGQIAHNVRARFAGANEWTKGGIAFPGLEPNGTSTAAPRTFILPSASCINTVCNPNALKRSDFKDDQATGVIDWVVNSKTYVNVTAARLFYGSHDAGATQNNSIVRNFNATTNIGLAGVPANLQQPSGYNDGPTNSWAVKDNYGRINVNADVTRYGHWKGEHALKGGFQWERIENDVDTGSRAANVLLSWDKTYTTSDTRLVRGTYGYYDIRRVYTAGTIHANNTGMFVQDAWTVNRKLTMNFGVRTESEDIPSYSPKDPGVHFGWADKIAPRVGFAYDVKGDSTWKLYGSWGVFNDITKLEMPRGSWGADHWISYYYTLDTPDWTSLNCEGPPGTGCAGTFIEQIDFRHPSNDSANPLTDPNLKPVKTQEITGGFDHELSRTMSFGVRYSHKWLNRTIEDVGILVPGIGEVFYIANPGFGIAQRILGDQFPTTPKAKRDYDGVEFRLRKRLANRWSTDTSFLISRLYGNYSGLASTDENGRTSPNVDRLFDGLYMSFDETGKPVYGRLATDRPFTFKSQTTYDLPWGTGLGAIFYAASGQPLSSQATIGNVPVFYKGRGNLGRLPTSMQTDLNIQHGFRLPGHTRAEVEASIINLFDQGIGNQIINTPYRDALPISQNTGFFNGVDVDAIAAATTSVRKDARFRQLSGFQGARSMRFMVKFNF